MSERLLDLTGRVALITGGSRGIGAASALVLAEHGASVVINSRKKSKSQAEEVLTKVQELKAEGLWIAGDISEEETGARLVKETVARFGRLDILVNNAGITADNLFVKMEEDEWERVIKTNLYGSMWTTKAALREISRRGSVIFISSEATHGIPGQANYSASKGGLEGMMRSLSVEYAKRGTRFNAISPGPVDTELFNAVGTDQREALVSLVPMKRMLKASEIANAVLFLASDMSSGITGQIINVDGGLYR